jgi:hypothetical protein
MEEPFNGWPFKTWTQGYVLGLINGAIVVAVLVAIALFLDSI